MKKGKTKNQTIHIQGQEEKTLCGKPSASATLWAKKSPPTNDHPGLCKRCYALFSKVEPEAPDYEKTEKSPKTAAERKPGKRQPALLILGDKMPKELVVTFKGIEHRATVNPDGTIFLHNDTGEIERCYTSPSRAGKAVTGREVDGWSFWSYEVAGEGLKKLNTLRQ